MKVESNFGSKRYAYYLRTVIYRPFSKFIFFGLTIFGAFAIVDWFTLGETALPVIITRTLFVLISAWVFQYMHSSRALTLPIFEAIMLVLANAIVIWVCVIAINQGISDYQSGAMLMMMYIGTISRMPIKESFVSLSLMLLCYVAFVSVEMYELDPVKENHQLSIMITTFVICIIACARRHLEVKERYLQYRKIRTQDLQLKAHAKQMQSLSEADGLTILNNRHYLDSIVVPTLPHLDNYGVLMIDIDHFKQINDKYGHLTGDNIIKAVAQIIAKTVPKNSYCIRYGGEEFLVVIPNTNARSLWETADDIRKSIAGNTFLEQTNKPVTVSIGIAISDNASKKLEKIISRADNALYKSKNRGRNCITM